MNIVVVVVVVGGILVWILFGEGTVEVDIVEEVGTVVMGQRMGDTVEMVVGTVGSMDPLVVDMEDTRTWLLVVCMKLRCLSVDLVVVKGNNLSYLVLTFK